MAESRIEISGPLDPLVLDHPAGRRRFLKALAGVDLWTLLHRPPGEGDECPQRNLVYWKHAESGSTLVPLFTSPGRFPHALPAPAVMVRVSTRVLASIDPAPTFCLNALDPPSLTLNAADLSDLRGFLKLDAHHYDAYGVVVPWAFRNPPDDAYHLAIALVDAFNRTGRVDVAYLYLLNTMGSSDRKQLFLAVDEEPDVDLATSLLEVSERAGFSETVSVRFLPRELAHQEGIAGLRLPPFYVRPRTDPSREA